MKRTLFAFAVLTMCLTSCDSFLQGMAGGMGGYGGYGMYGNPYATPIGVLPYNLRPDVYAANAYKQGMATVQAQTKQMAESAQRAKKQIEAQAAYNVKHGIVPVVVDNSSYSSSSSSSSSSSASRSGSTSSRDCSRCLGTGKCQTCNGRGYYDEIGVGSGRHACPNCASNHNGKCASCNGTGKS